MRRPFLLTRPFSSSQPRFLARPLALPFQQSQVQAEERFKRYHDTLLTSSNLAKRMQLDEAFLPFFLASAKVKFTLTSASLGFESWEMRWNSSKRAYERVKEISWRTLMQNHEFSSEHDPFNDGLQIYASYHYRRQLVDPLKATEDLYAHAVPFTSSLLDSQLTQRKVEPFIMSPDVARARFHRMIEAKELVRMQDFLRDRYSADQVENLQFKIEYSSFALTPFYVPTFIYKLQYLNKSFRTFVQGFNGAMGGQRFYRYREIGAGTFLITSFSCFLLGGSYFLSVLVPTTLVTLLGIYTPLVVSKLLAFQRSFEKRRDQHGGTKSQFYENEEVHEDKRYQQSYRQTYQRQTPKTEAKRQSSDPLEYYKTLNVSVGASKEDIQAAFRGLAMQQHPDRFQDPNKKQEAQAKFKRISEAYTVLRDGMLVYVGLMNIENSVALDGTHP